MKVHLGGADEMVCNLMEYRKFDVDSYCMASRVPIGAMFPWIQRCPLMFLCARLQL